MAGFSTNRFNQGKSLGDKKQFQDKGPKIEELIHIFKFPSNKKFQHFRLVGGIMSYAFWWLPINGKKLVNIPKQSLAWNPDTEELDSSIEDPYKDAADKLLELFPAAKKGEPQNRNTPKLAVHYYINAIIRNEEEDGDEYNPGRMTAAERETGYKDFNNSDSFTPVQVLRLPPGLASKIVGLAELNVHKINGEKRPMPVSDIEYGCDISIRFDDDKTGSEKYEVQKGEHTPLTEKEQNYLIYKLEGLMEPEDLATARAEAKKIVDSHSSKGFSRAGSGDEFDGGERRSNSRRGDVDEFDEPRRGGRAGRDDGDGGQSYRGSRGGNDDFDAPRNRNRGDTNDDFDAPRNRNRGDTNDGGASRSRDRIDPMDSPDAGAREPTAVEHRAARGGDGRSLGTTRASSDSDSDTKSGSNAGSSGTGRSSGRSRYEL